MERTQDSSGKVNLDGLPMETSPYLKYSDLEDYKRNAYGTEGHLPVKPNQRGAGSTDAPTVSGNDVPSVNAVVEASARLQPN